MNILAVDDEALQLEKLTEAIREVVPDAHIVSIRRPSQALYMAEETTFDVAFLDVQMRGMTGIELAQMIKRITPHTNFVFVTAYNDYKADAMDLRASGYITKPVTAVKVRQELLDLRYPPSSLGRVADGQVSSDTLNSHTVHPSNSLLKNATQNNSWSVTESGHDLWSAKESQNDPWNLNSSQKSMQIFSRDSAGSAADSALQNNAQNISANGNVKTGALLNIQCFGNFDVFDRDNKPIRFQRSKAKEMLAYIVFKKGSRCTNREIAGILFENVEYSSRIQDSFRHITSALMKALREAGAEAVILRDHQNFAIDMTLVNCDYYRFLQKDPIARNAYLGEFMSQYSWAESINAYLDFQL